jgi:hypothetical protein
MYLIFGLYDTDSYDGYIVIKVYGYAMNVFAVVHFQAFTTDATFYPGVCETMDSLYQYGGPSHQTYEVGKVVLLSLVNKLKSSKKIFQSNGTSLVLLLH